MWCFYILKNTISNKTEMAFMQNAAQHIAEGFLVVLPIDMDTSLCLGIDGNAR